jgi:eukaryotic-like serine/threonine-protein kinase
MGTSNSSARLASQERPDQPRYRLVSRIATGGMAEVFLALMPSACGLAKPVVIKRLWPELAQDPEHVQMFLDEVRLTLSLNHPNVIHAYEAGSDGSFPYLAMEYLDGQSFKHLLDRVRGDGGLSLPLSLKIICDLLAGLEYVHGLTDLSGKPLDVVHCDVSPQNVFVTCDGAVKLIDFGIAQSALARRPARPREIKGRAAYMAPEQFAGGMVDHRADIFAAGVILWEAAVGQRLWQGLSDGEIMQRLLSSEEPPRLPRGRGFPPGLAAVCARALALDPEQRYASASEFQSDLAAVATGSMPAQTRLLGGLITRAFANSRALSRTMIQQSLPEASATTSPVAPAADTLFRLQGGADVRTDGVTSRTSSSASLAALNDEVTQAGPFPPRPAGRRRWLAVGGLAFALLAGIWAYLRIAPIRIGLPAVAYGKKVSPRPAVTVAPWVPPTVQPRAMELAAPPPAPRPEVGGHAKDMHRSPAGKTHRRGTPPSSATADQVVFTRQLDPFDVALPRAAIAGAARPIDREDPYRP